MSQRQPKRTWIVVADAARARILAHERPGGGIANVEGAVFENPAAHGHSRDLGSDRPARSFESVGAARHAHEPRTDLHRQTKANFAKQIASYVEEAALRKDFDQLVLAAPPQLLGDLRAALRKHSAQSVVGALDKDLTRLRDAEIVAHLEPIIRI